MAGRCPRPFRSRNATPPHPVTLQFSYVKWLLVAEILIPRVETCLALENFRAHEVCGRLLSPELDIFALIELAKAGSHDATTLWQYLVDTTVVSCGVLGELTAEVALQRNCLQLDWPGWQQTPFPANAFDPTPAQPGSTYADLLLEGLQILFTYEADGVVMWTPTARPQTTG